jgi:O-antigen/teichoic acid export membrane protein
MGQNEDRWSAGCLGVIFLLVGGLLTVLSILGWIAGEDVSILARGSTKVRVHPLIAFGLGVGLSGLGGWGVFDWWKKRNDRIKW